MVEKGGQYTGPQGRDHSDRSSAVVPISITVSAARYWAVNASIVFGINIDQAWFVYEYCMITASIFNLHD